MAGVVKRADVKEDKDGKSRGMGTVTFEQPLEAMQAICILHKMNIKIRIEHRSIVYNFDVAFFLTLGSAMFNGQMLFDRQMHVKMVCFFLIN